LFGGLAIIKLKTTAALATITIAKVSSVSLSTQSEAASSAELAISAETALSLETALEKGEKCGFAGFEKVCTVF